MLSSSHPKERAGQSPLARTIKAILRPPLKAIYYILRWTCSHKLAALFVLLLLLMSAFATSYLATGRLPFTQPDTIDQDLKGSVNVSQDIKGWVLALHRGDISTMQTLERSMLIPADTGAYVLEFSEQYAHVQWDHVKLTTISLGPDNRTDTFLELDQSESIDGVAVEAIYFWHFTTNAQGHILFIDIVPARYVRKS